jgi:DNA invertase Pin-like site-specific DNA recombinase
MARKSRRQIDTPAIVAPARKMYNTAVYARLSVEDSGKKDNGDSIENQVYLIKQFIGERPYLKLCGEYVDNGETGVSFDRPQFNRMMDDIKIGKINCIVIKDLSRFGRNYIETGNFLEKIFPFLGVRLISVNDNYDTNDPSSGFDSLSISLKSLINDVYAKDISRKTSAALEIKQLNGEFIGSYAPYGYMKSPENRHKLVIDAETAPVVRDIFRWKTEGLSNIAIARKLNDLGIHSPGKHLHAKGIFKHERYANSIWIDSTIINILRNPVYTGCLSQGKSKTRLANGLCPEILTPDKWINIPNSHEAIISPETFDAVGEILRKNRADYYKKAGKYANLVNPENIFRGLMRCADCGASMKRRRDVKPLNDTPPKVHFNFICSAYEKNQTRACKCRKSVKEEALTESVWEAIRAEIDLCADTMKLVQKVQENNSSKSKTKSIKTQIVEVQRKIKRCDTFLAAIYDDYTENILAESEYLFAKAKYREEKRLLQQKEGELISISLKHSDDFIAENKWATALLQFNDEKQLTKSMLVELVDSIKISENNRINITFKHRDEYETLLNFIAEGGV